MTAAPRTARTHPRLRWTYSGIVITTTSPLPAATIGTPYSDTFTVSGGNGGKPKWSAQSGLPKGLKLKASTGVLSGTVKSKVVPGTYTLTIEVKETHKWAHGRGRQVPEPAGSVLKRSDSEGLASALAEIIATGDHSPPWR